MISIWNVALRERIWKSINKEGRVGKGGCRFHLLLFMPHWKDELNDLFEKINQAVL
jgi:hypothetical protein